MDKEFYWFFLYSFEGGIDPSFCLPHSSPLPVNIDQVLFKIICYCRNTLLSYTVNETDFKFIFHVLDNLTKQILHKGLLSGEWHIVYNC